MSEHLPLILFSERFFGSGFFNTCLLVFRGREIIRIFRGLPDVGYSGETRFPLDDERIPDIFWKILFHAEEREK
jgi:hypothetical protein